MILNASVYHRLIVHLGLTFCLRMMHRRRIVMDRRQLECWHNVPRVTRNSLPRLKTWHRLTLNIPRTFSSSSRETLGCLWKTMALFTRHISETFNPGLKVDIRSCLLLKKLMIFQSCIFKILQVNRFVTNPHNQEVFRNPCPVSSSSELPLTNERLKWTFSANQKPVMWSLFAVIHLQRLMSGLICPAGYIFLTSFCSE